MVFTLPTKTIAVQLGLDWAAPSHYFLRVKIVEVEEATPAVLLEWEEWEEHHKL